MPPPIGAASANRVQQWPSSCGSLPASIPLLAGYFVMLCSLIENARLRVSPSLLRHNSSSRPGATCCSCLTITLQSSQLEAGKSALPSGLYMTQYMICRVSSFARLSMRCCKTMDNLQHAHALYRPIQRALRGLHAFGTWHMLC